MGKKKEPTKILLINFDSKTANNVAQTTGVEVVRGYIGNGGYTENHLGVSEPIYLFYTPTPPYECAMVFINFDNFETPNKEFGSRAKQWTETETNNLFRYWSFASTLLVCFIGDARVSDLAPFGLPLTLKPASGVDKQTSVVVEDSNPHHQLIESIDGQLQMPNTHYINFALSGNELYKLGTKGYTLIRNSNGDKLAAVLTKAKDDYSMDEPGAIALPSVKQPSSAISKIVQHFASYYNVALSDTSWLESDIFYPSGDIGRLNEEIEQITEKTRKDIDARNQQISSIKSSYSYLKDLLTEQGDALVDAVYGVFTELLKLNVMKSDEQNGSMPKEDLLVEVSGKQILLEIKGTKRQNPSLRFPQQAMQHAIRQSLTSIASTGLVLNHDRETDPKSRSLAYGDKESNELIADIHFIDTRVLHAIALDLIDGKLKSKDAIAVLFESVGRATYPTTRREND